VNPTVNRSVNRGRLPPLLLCTLTVTLSVAWALVWAASPVEIPRASAGRMQQRIEGLSEFGANADGGVDRIAYSDADIAGREYVMELMHEAGLEVRVDAAANIIGRRQGSDNSLPVILFGSHTDSVPGGGNYDGDVGVIAAIEVAQLLHDNNIATRHPLEVVVFTDEEGGLTGSRAMIGHLSDDALGVVSHSGLTIGEGIEKLGGDLGRLDTARRDPGELLVFIEVHIEQGAILDEEDTDIGVVEGIVGINWWDVVIEGFANHAGTTPMDKRRDAMLSAAELILAVNRIVTSIPGRQVGTVGRIRAEPGAPNVIPGRVVMSLELRDLESEKIEKLFYMIEREAQAIAQRRNTPIRFLPLDVASEPAPTDTDMRAIIAESARELGLSYQYMPSGAGHDAQDLARITKAGMIFVPSRGGISHSPNEYTSPGDMANGADVLLRTILKIDGGALTQNP